MDSPFAYNRFVVGNDFLSRKMEVNTLTALLQQKHHVVIYDAPKTGKRSLVQQTLLNLQKISYNYNICDLNLFNIRSSDTLLRNMAHQIASCVSNTLSDWNTFSDKYLCHLDLESEEPLSQEQMVNIISLPEMVSKDFGSNIIIYFEEFQNILHFDNSDDFLRLLEKHWPKQKDVTYLITGSELNAMKYIFEQEKYFFNFAEHLQLLPLDEKAVSDHIVRTFLKVGRVVEPSQATYIYELMNGQPWYIWHISNICFNLTKGYLNDTIISDAVNALISTHEVRFQRMVGDLSNYQLLLLKAVNDGITRFSSVEVIKKYNLNSSANVHRLKEALMKKEIITFNENDEPSIIDPLFKLWLNKTYFAK